MAKEVLGEKIKVLTKENLVFATSASKVIKMISLTSVKIQIVMFFINAVL